MLSFSGQRNWGSPLISETWKGPFPCSNPCKLNGSLFFQPGSDSGTTAVVALIRGKQLIVANAGDSRCVLSEKGTAVDMSYDHKPEDELELARIKNAGGKVTMDGRVNGGLNLSRAIGNITVWDLSIHPGY